jgi:hypothetical protein
MRQSGHRRDVRHAHAITRAGRVLATVDGVLIRSPRVLRPQGDSSGALAAEGSHASSGRRRSTKVIVADRRRPPRLGKAQTRIACQIQRDQLLPLAAAPIAKNRTSLIRRDVCQLHREALLKSSGKKRSRCVGSLDGRFVTERRLFRARSGSRESRSTFVVEWGACSQVECLNAFGVLPDPRAREQEVGRQPAAPACSAACCFFCFCCRRRSAAMRSMSPRVTASRSRSAESSARWSYVRQTT